MGPGVCFPLSFSAGVALAASGGLSFSDRSPGVVWVLLVASIGSALLGLGQLCAVRRGVALRPVVRTRWLAMTLFALAAAGACVFCVHANALRADKLVPEIAGVARRLDFEVIGRIRCNDLGCRFLARLGCGAGDAAGHKYPLPSRAYVQWSSEVLAGVRPLPGECWQLATALSSPRGLRNPAGFDQERWLFAQHVGALARVRAHPANGRILAAPAGSLAHWRNRLRAALVHPPSRFGADSVLLGLGLGERDALPPAAEESLRRTGTAHLFVVSGLHVSMVAWLGSRLGYGLFLPLALRTGMPVQPLALALGLLVAGAYALLSGLALPALRAWLTALVTLPALASGRAGTGFSYLPWVLAVVLVIDPLAILDVSLWLSFGAVSLVLLTVVFTGTPRDRGERKLIRRMLGLAAVSVAMMPLTAAVFGEVSLTSPLANLVAIPAVSLVLLPGALLLMGLRALSAGFEAVDGGGMVTAIRAVLWLCEGGLGAVWRMLLTVLAVLGQPPWTQFTVQHLGWPGAIGLLLCLLCLLCPMPRRVRMLLLPPLLTALLLTRPPRPAAGEFEAIFVDVGQGLSVVVRTQHHTLVYDTGPAWRGHAVARRTLLPMLEYWRTRALERVVISHRDIDHRGGLTALIERFPGTPIFSNPGYASVAGLAPCRAGDRWALDGVEFRVLWPNSQAPHSDDTRLTETGQAASQPLWTRNNASCVLEVSSEQGLRLLLTGDIEAPVEQALMTSGDLRPVAALSVPHHGSLTSSTPEFIAALSANAAVVATGVGNRFGLPRAAVIQRYADAGITVWDTACRGAVRVTLGHILEVNALLPERPWRDTLCP